MRSDELDSFETELQARLANIEVREKEVANQLQQAQQAEEAARSDKEAAKAEREQAKKERTDNQKLLSELDTEKHALIQVHQEQQEAQEKAESEQQTAAAMKKAAEAAKYVLLVMLYLKPHYMFPFNSGIAVIPVLLFP